MTVDERKILVTLIEAGQKYREAWSRQNAANAAYGNADREKELALQAANKLVGKNIRRRLLKHEGQTLMIEYREGMKTPTAVVFNDRGEEVSL